MTPALQRLAARARAIAPRTFLILGWLGFLLYAYPGYMSSDSIDQLLDARVGTFNDWHSATMTQVWRVTDFFLAGPFGMLVVQSLLLLLGAYALLARATPPRRAAILAAVLLVLPPVIVPAAVIWQDSQLTGFLVAGLAAVTSARRGRRLAGLGLLVLACAMRPSAALAVLPILALGFAWGRATGWRRRAIALTTWAAVWLAALGFDACVRDQTTDHAALELASYDLLGVLRYAGHVDDARVRAALAGVAIRGDDLQRRGAALYSHPGKLTEGEERLFDPPATAAERDAIIDGAHRLGRAFPGAYLVHRWHVLYRVLGVRRNALGRPLYNGYAGSPTQADEASHLASHSAVQRVAIAAVALFKSTPLFWPYVWLVLAIALIPLAAARRLAVPVILLVSGVVYEASLFVVALEPMFRLSHWLITATSLAGLLVIVDAVDRRLARRRDPVDLGA